MGKSQCLCERLEECRRTACNGGKDMDGTEYNKTLLNDFAGYNRRGEIKCANIERAAQLRIVCA